MHRTHAHHKFQKNGFARAHHNLLPHIATRNLLLHIASHALQKTVTFQSISMIFVGFLNVIPFWLEKSGLSKQIIVS
jgi:hypothetical protein